MPTSKKLLVPDVRPEEPVASAEIRIGPQTLDVTLFLPDLDPNEAEFTVTPYTLRVQRRGDTTGRSVVYALPVACQAGQFVARAHNGLYTILIDRARRSR